MCGCDYVPPGDIPSDQQAEFDAYTKKIFPRVDELSMFKKWLGNCLSGHTTHKTVAVLTDERAGSNSKSAFMAILEKLLGSYYLTAKEIFYAKSTGSAEGASPFLADMDGKRVVACEEMSGDKPIDGSLIKNLTSGIATHIRARPLYGSPFSMLVQAKIMLLCNEGRFPNVDFSDTALLGRFLVCPFRSKFVFDKCEVEPHTNTHHANTDFGTKVLPQLVAPLLHFCIDGLKELRASSGLSDAATPTAMLNFKQQVILSASPARELVGRFVVFTGATGDKFTLEDLWGLVQNCRDKPKSFGRSQLRLIMKGIVIEHTTKELKDMIQQDSAEKVTYKRFKLKIGAAMPVLPGLPDMGPYFGATME